MNLVRHLQRRIRECDPDSEGIPGWCVATGKCTCIRAEKLIRRLERASKGTKNLAAEVYQLGCDIEEYTP